MCVCTVCAIITCVYHVRSYIAIYVCMYVCTCIHTYIHTYVCANVHSCLLMYMYIAHYIRNTMYIVFIFGAEYCLEHSCLFTYDHHHVIFASNRLIEVLGDFGQNDWQLSSLVCKTLWNFSDKLTSSVLCFGVEEADLIAEQLEVYLGEGQHWLVCIVCTELHYSYVCNSIIGFT